MSGGLLGPATVSAQSGVIFVIDGLGGPGALFSVDLQTGSRTTVSTGGSFVSPSGMTAAPGGGFYVTNFAGGGALLHVSLSGAQTVITAGGFGSAQGVAVEADGKVLVVDRAASTLFRIDPASGARTTLASGAPFVDPVSVATGPGGQIFVGDTAGVAPGFVFRVDPGTGSRTVVSQGGLFVDPFGVTWGLDGNLYVVDFGAGADAIFRVNPTTGAQTVVSSGGNFVTPTHAVFAPDGQMYVVDVSAVPGSGAIFRINQTTGAQTTVASGPPFVDPIFLAFAASPPSSNQPPAFGAPACGSSISVPLLGNAALAGTVAVSASDPNAGQSVGLAASGLPGYATLTSSPGNPATGQINANPSIFDWVSGLFGATSTVTLTATDNATPPASASCQLTLRVRLATGSPI